MKRWIFPVHPGSLSIMTDISSSVIPLIGFSDPVRRVFDASLGAVAQLDQRWIDWIRHVVFILTVMEIFLLPMNWTIAFRSSFLPAILAVCNCDPRGRVLTSHSCFHSRNLLQPTKIICMCNVESQCHYFCWCHFGWRSSSWYFHWSERYSLCC